MKEVPMQHEPASFKAMRANARTFLAQRIDELERELVGLRALSGSLPLALNPEADESLYQLLERGRRR
jgi:hypothetical protein